MEGRPPLMKGSCEYIERAAAESRKEGLSTGIGLDMALTTLCHKNKLVNNCSKEPRIWKDSLDNRSKGQNMDMTF